MKMKIEFQNVTVILTNAKGEKFTQDIGLSGEVYVPANFQTPEARMIVKEDIGDKTRIFNRAVSPKKEDRESKGFGYVS